MRDQRVATLFYFFNDTATTEIYTLSLHDALPILLAFLPPVQRERAGFIERLGHYFSSPAPRRAFLILAGKRSEEHTSELQSLAYLVCRLLLEKKKIHAL